MVKEFYAEAVGVISNQYLTEKLVYGLNARGIPAYGAIFDSYSNSLPPMTIFGLQIEKPSHFILSFSYSSTDIDLISMLLRSPTVFFRSICIFHDISFPFPHTNR